MFDKFRFKNKFLTAGVLYGASILIRLMAFFRFYILSHEYGANSITDKYVLYLFVMEIMAYLLASNHVTTLLMRYFSQFKLMRNKKKAFSYIFILYVYLTIFFSTVTSIIMHVFFNFSLIGAIFIGIASTFFVLSVIIQSILNYLEYYESIAYQDIVGHTILLLGVLSQNIQILFGSLLVYGVIRFLFLFIFLYRRHLVVFNSVHFSLNFFKKLFKNEVFKEIMWLTGAFLISTIAIFIQNYFIKQKGEGYFSAFNYAQRLITALIAFMILPIIPMFANYIIKLKKKQSKREVLKKLTVSFWGFNLLLFIGGIVLWLTGKWALKLIYFHGAFTAEDLELTWLFFKALIVTIWSFNVMSILTQVTLIFQHAKYTFYAYLFSTIAFLGIFLYWVPINIITGIAVSYLVSGLVFVFVTLRAIMKYN